MLSHWFSMKFSRNNLGMLIYEAISRLASQVQRTSGHAGEVGESTLAPLSPMRGGRMERKVASDYPQELLDLFHEYQHGDINRRAFLDRAAKFAVGGLTLAAIFESLSPNYAWAQQVPPDDKRIKADYEVVQ